MKRKLYNAGIGLAISIALGSCVTPQTVVRTENKTVPATYVGKTDTTNLTSVNWKNYFSDATLVALIDTALSRNQELNITLQEIEIAKNEVRARKGEYLPFVNFGAGAGVEKTPRFTRSGAVEENLQVDGKSFPEPFTDYRAGLYASWELDVWKKLRNAKKAATLRYLASIEGKNFMVTNLVAEIANSYYELLALDNLLDIVQRNTQLQTDAFQIVKQQKEAAKVTQLAVNRFEAQLLNTKNLQYEIKQRIVETENRIHFLTGKFPTRINRNFNQFTDLKLDSIAAGIPSQLLSNRPDIRQAELQLAASKLDVKSARANFYPSFGITAGAGFQSFNAAYLIKPESMLYNLAGDLMAPLVNRNAIKAAYNSANARQLQSVYDYERSILNGYLEVLNQLAKVNNFAQSYTTKAQEVEILTQSISISNSLFTSARADYLEVLLTQREALESKMELIEIKLKQMNARVTIYKALGGGWN
ncbi:MAG: efflux transporter outer membrane subunit [Cytophagales bacterium]|nr:efflux transporter outer membrane subunit [Cytophagales bacterium]